MGARHERELSHALLVLILCLPAPPTFAQDSSCPVPSDVITEDVQLTQHMSNFPSCTLMNGDLRIGHQDCSTPCRVTGFSPLRAITGITGALSIQCCNSLTDVSDFSALTKLGSLRIYYNSELVMISGFTSLPSLPGSVTISQNTKLARISGLTSLRSIDGYLAIERNAVLFDLSGLRQVTTLRGTEIISGHALSIIYNARLTDLSGLASIYNISYGTVHVEGNTALCYAGYPTWQPGAYPLRPHPSVVGADVGIDWRTRLSGVEPWQSAWGVQGGGYPTLIIQNNAPPENCTGASCHSTCPDGAGCLGPNDPALCGSCDLVGGTFDPCATSPAPTSPPSSGDGGSSNTGVIVGVVVVVLLLVIVVLGGLGAWVGVVCVRKWKEGKQGSFDISVGGLESADYDNEPKKRRHFSKSKPSDLIASYSASADQSGVSTRVTIRSISDEPDGKATDSAHVPHPPRHHSPVARVKASPKRPAPQASPGGRTGVRQPPGKQGGAKGLKHQTSSMENLLSGSSNLTGEGAEYSSQNSGDDYSQDGTLSNGNNRVSFGPDRFADSANRVSTNGDSAGVASTNGKASLRVRGHADSSNGGNRSSQFSNGGVSAESASNRTSMASRASVMSRDASVEDILQKLLQEESDVPMNFPREQVKVIKEMGRGDFGKVLQAEARKLLPGQKKTSVVVKQLKAGASEEERQAFLRPVEAMKILRHANVLSLMGMISKGPVLQVMLEYCSLGNFKTFLVTRRKGAASLKGNGQLLRMAVDMASGLGYLHSMSVAHNDFAVRSCLVSGEGTVKLGDYGITRQTFKEDYYSRSPSQKAWPVRWMAPEQVMVEGTDILDSYPVSMPANIWSFGIALWEVSSFAQWPYDEMSNEEVIQMVIKSGKCSLENPLSPGDAVAHLFDICQLCWQEPSLRPTMEELLTMLKEPSTIKRKRRSASLTRQNFVGLPPSRSHTLPPAQSDMPQVTKVPPPKSEPRPAGDDTLKRKPKRPAPTLPPPHKHASVKERPVPGPSQQVPVKSGPIPKPEPARQAPPQPARAALAVSPPKRPAPKKPPRTPETWRAASSSDLLNVPQVGGREINGRSVPANTVSADLKKESSEPLGMWNSGFEADDVALYPDSVDSNDLDESMFEGGTEVMPDAGDDQDFILEPPDDFSQLSAGDLDDDVEASVDTRKHETHGMASSMAVQFSNPAALGDWGKAVEVFPEAYGQNQEEGQQDSASGRRSRKAGEIGHEENAGEVAMLRQSSTEHKSSKSKKSKKKRESRGDSEAAGSKKHKSKKKKRHSVSTDELLQQGDSQEVVLPEYEFDRGMDRVPMRSSQDPGNFDVSQSKQQPTWSHGSFKTYSQEEPDGARTKGVSNSHVSASYDNAAADDDYSPPWLHDNNPVQSQELSFEELDAYAEDDEKDEPRVVYKEDVAAMVW